MAKLKVRIAGVRPEGPSPPETRRREGEAWGQWSPGGGKDLQKVTNFPQPVFLGLKFPQEGHKFKMQHFAKNL